MAESGLPKYPPALVLPLVVSAMPMHFCIDDSMSEEPVTVDSSPWLHDWSDDLPVGEACHGTVLATAAPPPPPPWPPALEAEVEPTSSSGAWPQQEPDVAVDAWGERRTLWSPSPAPSPTSLHPIPSRGDAALAAQQPLPVQPRTVEVDPWDPWAEPGGDVIDARRMPAAGTERPAPRATLAGVTVSTHAVWDAWESTVPPTHVPQLFDAWGNPEPASSPTRYSTRAATDTTANARRDAWELPGPVPPPASTTSSPPPPPPHALAVLAGHQPSQPMPSRGVAPDPWDAWAESSAPSSTPPSPLLDAWGNPEPAWDLAPASLGGPFPEYDAWAED